MSVKSKEEIQLIAEENLISADNFLKLAMKNLSDGNIEKSKEYFNIVAGKFINILQGFEDE